MENPFSIETFLDKAGKWKSADGSLSIAPQKKTPAPQKEPLFKLPQPDLKKNLGFLKDVAQAPARAAATAVISLGNFLSGEDRTLEVPKKEEGASAAERGLYKLLFGDKSIGNVRKVGSETLSALGATKKAQEGKFATPVGIALTALDLLPIGGEKKAVEKLALAKDAGAVSKVLRTLNIVGPDAERITPLLVRAETPEAVQAILKTAGMARSVGKASTNPLLSEARKYKTAEEFVRMAKPRDFQEQVLVGQEMIDDIKAAGLRKSLNSDGTITFFHGTKPEIAEKILQTGRLDEMTFGSPLKGKSAFGSEGAMKYGGRVLELKVDPRDVSFNRGTGEFEAEEGLIRGMDGVWRSPKRPQLTSLWEQAQKGVKTAAEIGGGGVKRERGLVTSVKEAFPEAKKVAGQYISRSTDQLAVRAKNLIRSDIETAEKIARTGTDDNAVATAMELIKDYGNRALNAADDATRGVFYDRAAEVANAAAKNLTEAGRTVQAASILGRLTPEGQLRFAAKEIQRYNASITGTSIGARTRGMFGLRKKIPELTGQQANEILTEMRAIQSMPEGLDKAMRFQKLQDHISALVPTSLFKKVVSVWKAGLLTGIKTSGLNIFSNLAHGATEIAKDVPAVAVDSVASLFTGKRTTALTARQGAGIKEGIEKGWQYLKTGYSERDLGSKLDYSKVSFGKGPIAKALQKYEESVFRVVGAEDQPFYYGAKARSLYGQALAAGKNEGLSGKALKDFAEQLVKNPTDEMVRYAVLDAETAVFQNPTMLGKVAKAIQKIPGGEVVVPFGRTPSAVATQVINYSPIGIVKTIAENIGKGRFDQRLFSQGLGRGLVGTGILYLGSKLYEKGMVSLGRPSGEREQKLWELEGRTANSIKIGGKWRSAAVLGPAGITLLVGGYFRRGLEETGSPTAAMMQAFFGGMKSLTEQTFLKGINQVAEAINDPERFGEGYLGSILSSTIPTIVSDVSRAKDRYERRTDTILDRIKARLPLIREELEPQVDVLGHKRESVGNAIEILADPTRPSKAVENQLVDEFRRLQDAGYPSSPTLLGDKQGYKVLTAPQNTELWQRAGEIAERKLTALIAHPEYAKLSDEDKAKTIDTFVQKAKDVARAEMVLQITDGLEGEPLKRKLSELKAGKLLTQDVYNLFLQLR